MKILAIETTGKYGSAAVADEKGVLSEASSYEEMNHLRGMIGLIDTAIREAGIKKEELTHIAASVGPGSFTGIRIGVTTARTMAQMLGVPCIGVSTLEAMARGASKGAAACGAGLIAPIINARRHQTYAAVYETGRGSDGEAIEPLPFMAEKQYMIEELLEELAKSLAERSGSRIYFTGDGIDAYADIIRDAVPEGSYIFAETDERYQTAGSAALTALGKAEAGDVLTYDRLMPEYMRLAEAEQRLRAGTLSERIRKPVGV